MARYRGSNTAHMGEYRTETTGGYISRPEPAFGDGARGEDRSPRSPIVDYQR
jgi:hypothetical protein